MQNLEFDIIETNYIKNLKGFSPYFQIITIIATFYFVIEFISDDFLTKNDLINTLFTVIVGIFIVIFILDSILFSRIGTISFRTENIVFTIKGECSEFSLNDIQEVKVNKVQNRHYRIKAKPYFELIIELTEGDLIKIEEYFVENNIEYNFRSFGNWIKQITNGSF